MNDSRLFKATRRSIRAEVTLIVVIVISFSWSAYALYKLALGSSDSFLDFGLGQWKTNQQHTTQPNQSKPDHEDLHTDARNLSEQLAIYKSQILKELLARQRQLLVEAPADRYQAAPTSLNGQHVDRTESTLKPVNIEELKQWRGGFKMPTTIDYLFEAGEQANRRPKTNDSQLDRIPSSSSEHVQGSLNSALIPLTDAPSLMQLSKFKPADSQRANSQATRLKDFKLRTNNEHKLNEPSGDEARSHNEEASSDDSQVTGSQAQSELTTTTTIPPTFYEQEIAETTTVEPTPGLPDADVETSPTPADEGTEEGELRSDEKLSEHDQAIAEEAPVEENKANTDESDDETNHDDGSMERVKSTVRAIDEEVDRMTQPSLGMASQQDKSFDYKNTVQFDDSLPASIQRELDNDIKNKVSKSTDADFHRQHHRPARRPQQAVDETDLQVADNRSKLPIGVTHAANPLKLVPTRASREKELASKRAPVPEFRRKEARDQKRIKTEDDDIQMKTRRKPAGGAKLRKRRSSETNLISKTLDSIKPRIHAKRNQRSLRRSNDHDESDDSNQSDGYENDDEGDSSTENPSDVGVTPREKLLSSYQTITSNDPTLQELLAHKRLLDELQQSQVPSPVAWPSNQLQPQQQKLNSTFVEPSRQNHGLLAGEAKAGQPDHQSADTHYTVDHGLLLYPAEDEEHHHKSMSKKSKKASHKKAKKKMTVAMKKGGHKNKKHKKEEKKYLKEKKFKGAKKGKKMSKGKGGKGGKKGKKYYKDKGFKKKGFKNIYVKNEFGQKKSYFDEFRDKDFKKKWKNFDDKYNYAQMKKWQAKDVKGAKKMKDQGENYKKYDKGKWKKKYHKHQASESAKKKKKMDEF